MTKALLWLVASVALAVLGVFLLGEEAGGLAVAVSLAGSALCLVMSFSYPADGDKW